MILRVENLGMVYSGPNGPVPALDSLSFELAPREFLAVVGPSGCGKTTLLKILAGILKPSAGGISEPEDTGRERNVALVFQDHGLFPWMTVADNVAFGLEARGYPRRERSSKALDILKDFGLDGFAGFFPHHLSGGMRQRVGLARSFLVNPDLLLMDEPFASVDAQTRLRLQAELLKHWSRTRCQVIYVTHDIEEAIRLSDRIIVLSARPARIKQIIKVPIPRPRSLIGRDEPDIKDFKWQIWHQIDGNS